MLPHIQRQKRHRAENRLKIMLLHLKHNQPVAHRLIRQYRPSAPLNARGGFGEMRTERLDRAKAFIQRIGQPRLAPRRRSAPSWTRK